MPQPFSQRFDFMSQAQTSAPGPLATYQDLLQQTEAQLDAMQRRYRLLSNVRLIWFLAGAGLTYGLFTLNFWAGMLTGILLLLGFMYLLKIHSDVADQRDHQRRRRRILHEEIAAQGWDYRAFDGGKDLIDPHHAFSYDLDLFGERSLFQYLNRSGSETGRARLAHWLMEPERSVPLIQARQGAVRELATQLDWTLEFQAAMRAHRATREEVDSLLGWLATPAYFSTRPVWKLLSWALPALLGLSLLLWIVPDFPALRGFFGGWHLSGWVPLALFLLQLALAGQNLKRANHQHQQVSKKARLLGTYAQLLAAVEVHSWNSPALQALQQRLTQGGTPASQLIEALGQQVYRWDQRLNMIAGVLLNGTLSWDLRFLLKFEAWRAQHHQAVPQWFEVIEEIDALLSLARLAYNRPDLSWPEFETGEFFYAAEHLGHVLLKPELRVDNSVTLHKPGEFLVITGANMAGKSTFLRSVGSSLVLAMAGGPVCAQRLRLAPIPLISSVRATDSLADDESYFYAELKQLKRIIDQLQAQGPAFVIVDEMLRGTNSRDKQTGSRRFIEQLIRLRGVGLVATHDLSLGTLAEEYPDFVRNQRFEVDITDEQLTFDYRLRDGISQNLNATFLMQQMGIMPRGEEAETKPPLAE